MPLTPWIKRSFIIGLFLTALTLGAGARCIELSKHFTNTDDLGITQVTFLAQEQRDLFLVSKRLTNAPFQYVFTYFMISPKMDYLPLLFWSRLPSCISGCLALFFLLVFYRFFPKSRAWPELLLSLALAACSWESIAFAKQAHSYAIGVLAATLICCLFAYHLRRAKFTFRSAAATGAILALLGTMQYQILLFIPGFYVALFIYYRSLTRPEEQIKTGICFLLSGIIFLTLFSPVWFYLLKPFYKIFADTLPWTAGPNGEYAPPAMTSKELLMQWKFKIFLFYLKNTFYIFKSKVAFFPETHFLFLPVIIVLFTFFIAGIFYFFFTSHPAIRALGIFFGLVLTTWGIMVPLKGLPFSPSRHTLILLPLIGITTSLGLSGIFSALKKIPAAASLLKAQNKITPAISVFVVILFSLNFKQFLDERRTPFNPAEVCSVLHQYHPDQIFFDSRSLHLEYVKCLDDLSDQINRSKTESVRTFALLTRYPIRSLTDHCEALRTFQNQLAEYEIESKTATPLFFDRSCGDFKVIHSITHDSNVMEGFTPNLGDDIYANRFYFYIFSSDPQKQNLPRDTASSKA